jgi:hypothetical protein
MFDEMQRLREVPGLLYLLTHYQEKAKPDRQAWQDRLLEVEGVDSRDLIRLHGELLAYGWLEQNTGMANGTIIGLAPACYRITTTGVRAIRECREVVPA